MSSFRCIPPNPDISGIGVRTAMYAQAALCLLHPVIASLDGKYDRREKERLFASMLSLSLLLIALVLSAIIQTGLSGISPFHAVVVLNLYWLVFLSMGAMMHASSVRRVIILAIVGLIRECLVASFALRLWITMDHQDPCTSLTHYIILFKFAIPLTSRSLRTASIAVYAVLFACGLCDSAFAARRVFKIRTKSSTAASALQPQSSSKGVGPQHPVDRLGLRLLPVAFVYQVYWIVCTELTIRHNAHLLIQSDSGENSWTFGQTLAMAMLVVPLYEVFMAGWDELQRRKGGQQVEEEKQEIGDHVGGGVDEVAGQRIIEERPVV